jgi:flagellar biosynthesis/type III secretory pathway protein FliH
MSQTARQTAPALKVVEPTAAQRLRAQQEAIKAEATQSLAALLDQAAEVAREARDLGTIDTYTAAEREALSKLAASVDGTLRTFNRPAA